MITIEIDDRRIDFDPAELPGFYFALQDLLDLSAIVGSRSTTLAVPATNAVRDILGGPSMAEEVGIEDLKFRVLAGSAILYSGRAKVLSRSMDQYELVVIGDNAAWKDGAAALQLRDIELGNTPIVNRPYQKSTWEDEDSIVTFPVIDYGGLYNRPNSYNVQPSMLRPAIRIWLLLKKGFQTLGYSIQAERSLKATWKKFILPCVTSKALSLSNGAEDAMVMIAPCCGLGACPYTEFSYIYALNANNNATPGFLGFSFYSGQGADYAAPGRYVASADGPVAASMRARLFYSTSSFITFNYIIYNTSTNTPLVTVSQTYSNTGNFVAIDETFAFPLFNGVQGEEYGIAIHVADLSVMTGPGVLPSLCSTPISAAGAGHIVIGEGCESRWVASTVPYTADLPLIINSSLPEEMSLFELLKWWTTMQNIVVRTDELTHHIRLDYYDDFCRPTSEGIDWSYRVDHTDPPRKVTDVLPKSYQFRFAKDDKDGVVEDINDDLNTSVPYGGHDHIVVGGQDSPEQVNVGFAATGMAPILGAQMVVMAMRDNTFDVDIDGHLSNQFNWKPRIAYIDGLANSGWTFNGVQEYEYPRAYFIWPEQGRNNLSFGNETQQGSITPGTVVTRWRNRLRRSTAPYFEGFILIHDGELMGFDFGVPVYLHDGTHGSWFYFVEIKRHQFLQEGTTECKLVRV